MRAYTFHGKRNICGDRIRIARLSQRLSQADLCRKLQLAGIPMERDSISRIESQPICRRLRSDHICGYPGCSDPVAARQGMKPARC